MTTTDQLLRIYLQDHHAGATAGVARARRLAAAEADSADGEALGRFARDVDDDLASLVRRMDAFGIPPSRSKSALASVAERVGALKPNGFVVRRSPLSTVVELEAMQMAARGKRSMWETLRAITATRPADSFDTDGLIRRADEQLAFLTATHEARIRQTFEV